MNPAYPTPYPDVNALLEEVLVGVQQILRRHFIGMYLEGSLVSDDFDQDSDIDFVVVTDEDVSSDLFAALQATHGRIATIDSWYAVQLEGFYISQQALRRHDPAHALHPNIERGPGERLKLAYHDCAWLVHRSILRERGVALAGPASKTLIGPISPVDLQRRWWNPFNAGQRRSSTLPRNSPLAAIRPTSSSRCVACSIPFTPAVLLQSHAPLAGRWRRWTNGGAR